MKYTCECCNYTTQRKFNYDKHMVSNKHKLVKGTASEVSLETELSNCQMNELKIIMERLDKHEKQLNEQNLQIQNIISEIF
jgi:hypothetical protein